MYKLSYNTRKIILSDSIFKKVTMVKWNNDVTLLKIISR